MLEVKANALEESFDAILQADRIAGLEERIDTLDEALKVQMERAGAAAARRRQRQRGRSGARGLHRALSASRDRGRSRAQELLGRKRWGRRLCCAARDRRDDRGGAESHLADPRHRQCRAHGLCGLSQAGDDGRRGLGLGRGDGIAHRNRHADLPGNRAALRRALCQSGRQPGDAGRRAVRRRELAGRRDCARVCAGRGRRVRERQRGPTSPRASSAIPPPTRRMRTATSGRCNMWPRGLRVHSRRPIRRTSSSTSSRPWPIPIGRARRS